MAYEINVAKDKEHFFATAPRSCRTELDAIKVARELIARFPACDGYSISISEEYQVSRECRLNIQGEPRADGSFETKTTLERIK